MANGKTQDRQREACWRRMVRGQQRGGLTVREFCRRNRLREPAFYLWRRELERRDLGWRQAEQEQRRRPSAAACATNRAAFVPVRVTTSFEDLYDWLLRHPAA